MNREVDNGFSMQGPGTLSLVLHLSRLYGLPVTRHEAGDLIRSIDSRTSLPWNRLLSRSGRYSDSFAR